MATLVLSTVGTLLGGPIGGALGSLVGQAIDQQLLGPGPRRGPRLGELSVQTSSYGSPIPKVFGTMRVAGSVVWATDLKEEENLEGGGKTGPEIVTYAYSASFAVALSARRAVRVARIWADGRLIRGSRGDFKVGCKFRFYPGSEDQAVDPLIASVEGIGKAPAFRGLALAVFEDLQLAEFGNRIPLLTFELVADPGELTLGELLREISAGVIVGEGGGQTIGGYAAYGADRRAAIEQIIDLFGVRLLEQGRRLSLSEAETLVAGDADERGCQAGGRDPGEQRRQLPARSLPASLTLNYYDPDRDHQAGQMRAMIAGGGRGQWRADLPMALVAADAKRVANDAMARQWAERDRLTVRLDPAFLALAPGETVDLPDIAGRWRVQRVTIEEMVVVAELQRMADGGHPLVADSGRIVAEPDVEIGATDLALFDLPRLPLFDTRLQLVVAASTDGAFKPVPVGISVNGQPGGVITAARRAVMGRTSTALGAGPDSVIDTVQSVDVELTDRAQILLNADDDALAHGANLALVGEEVLQFGRAELLGDGRYRLSGLLRGRHGTEWAIAGHGIGERFLLLRQPGLVAIPIDPAMRGAAVEVVAQGLADDPIDPPRAMATAGGEALLPDSPCHLAVRNEAGGGLRITWIGRGSWNWTDSEGDVPQTYRVTATGAAAAWTGETAANEIQLSAVERAELGAGPIAIAVEALGASGRSRPATTTIG